MLCLPLVVDLGGSALSKSLRLLAELFPYGFGTLEPGVCWMPTGAHIRF